MGSKINVQKLLDYLNLKGIYGDQVVHWPPRNIPTYKDFLEPVTSENFKPTTVVITHEAKQYEYKQPEASGLKIILPIIRKVTRVGKDKVF